MNIIPQIVKDFAGRHNVKNLEYIGTKDGTSVFIALFLDKDGNPIPSGPSMLFTLKDNNVQLICGMESFDLLACFV